MIKTSDLDLSHEFPKPDIIFLDINMPRMEDGFEFLEEYNQLDEKLTSGMVIPMLTTSLNPNNQESAKELKVVREFKNKPLTPEMLQEIAEKYFLRLTDRNQITYKRFFPTSQPRKEH